MALAASGSATWEDPVYIPGGNPVMAEMRKLDVVL
jgi:hypothetical protein